MGGRVPGARLALATMTKPFGPRGLRGLVAGLFAVVAIALTLGRYSVLLQRYLAVRYDTRIELGMVTAQVLFQWAFLVRRTWEERLSYAWVLITVSSVGALLLWPAILFGAPLSPPRAAAYFFAVVAVMFGVHWALVVRHHLPKWLCATWVLYRLLLLIYLLRLDLR
jgi:hypothetical protein